jgi:hypothetical protein
MKQRRDSIQRHWTALGVAVALACTLAFSGCGGGGSSGSSTGPSSTPTPAPVRNVVAQGNFTGLQPSDPLEDDLEDIYILFFTTSQTGTLDITVDWTHASNDVDFILLRGTLEQVLSPACQALDEVNCPLEIVSTAVTLAKPEVTTVNNATAGGYIVAVVNFGTTNEAGVVVVGLTTT